MKYTIIGIDPGLSGAVGILKCEDDKIVEVLAFDTPTHGLKAKSSKKVKQDYILPEMVKIIKENLSDATYVCLEKVFSMSGQGVTSSFNFGRGFGLWEGIFAALELNVELVTPQSWKKVYKKELIQPHIERPEELSLTAKQISKLTIKEQKEVSNIVYEYEKEKRLAKSKAKDSARLLAISLFNKPELFKLKKHSDRAEALLIAEYFRRKLTNG